MAGTKSILETFPQASDVSRRDLFRKATIFAGGAAVLATTAMTTGAKADAAKISQAAAAYQPSPNKGQRCVDCSLYQAPASCKLVEGNISPAGWCKLFSKKS